jgi:hypothetical protein
MTLVDMAIVAVRKFSGVSIKISLNFHGWNKITDGAQRCDSRVKNQFGRFDFALPAPSMWLPGDFGV